MNIASVGSEPELAGSADAGCVDNDMVDNDMVDNDMVSVELVYIGPCTAELNTAEFATIPPQDIAVAETYKGSPRAKQRAESWPMHQPQRGQGDVGTRAPTGANTDPYTPTAGDRIRNYELIREIGRGGMGTVFLARDTKIGRRVAIKLLTKCDRSRSERFIDEARVTAHCNHENIVVLYEVDEYRGTPYMVLEFLRGKTLRHVLKASGMRRAQSRRGKGGLQGLRLRRTLELAIPVVRALVSAHSRGIVHRDLKPENIMLTENGTVKVLDFGIAKLVRNEIGDNELNPDAEQSNSNLLERLSVTAKGALIGTPPYMAPEQLDGGEIDHRTDLWAVGIMLYELISGTHPLAPFNPGKLYRVINRAKPMPRAAERLVGIGPMADIIDRCLCKDKDERFASARELLQALEALVPGRQNYAEGAQKRIENPYTGLAAFQEADASKFFGRQHDIEHIVNRLRCQPMVTVVGASGVGKSSLVRAGVIPSLKNSGDAWESLTIRPGRRPLEALANVIERGILPTHQRMTSGHVNSMSARCKIMERLRAEPGYLGVYLRRCAGIHRRRVLLFVDQLEELFTLCADAEERRIFLTCLDGAADDASSPLRVVQAVRADFLDRMAETCPSMAQLAPGLVFLTPMHRHALRESLVRPLEMADYQFEDASLVATMLDAVEGSRMALPLLQFTASQLWSDRDEGHKLLTRASYDSVGGVDGALASHADAILAGMRPAEQELVRVILERLVTPERTRIVTSVAELHALAVGHTCNRNDIEAVIQRLAAARLLVIEVTDTGRTVELVHESLIMTWPTLRHWLDENQDDAEFLNRLRSAVELWSDSGCRDDLLWRGQAAKEALMWARHYSGVLHPMERAFVDAVSMLDARVTRTNRLFIASIIIVPLVLFLITGGFYISSHNKVEALREKNTELQQSLQVEKERRNQAEENKRQAQIETKRAADGTTWKRGAWPCEPMDGVSRLDCCTRSPVIGGISMGRVVNLGCVGDNVPPR